MAVPTPSSEADLVPVSPLIQVVRIGCIGAGAIAAAYLWAVLVGRGLHGLVLGPGIDSQKNYPGADAAFIAALATYVGSPIAAWWWGHLWFGMPRWLLATAAAGLVLFGVAALVF
jgi:hypothetical protein